MSSSRVLLSLTRLLAAEDRFVLGYDGPQNPILLIRALIYEGETLSLRAFTLTPHYSTHDFLQRTTLGHAPLEDPFLLWGDGEQL